MPLSVTMKEGFYEIDARTNTVVYFTIIMNKKKNLILMISGKTPLLILPVSDDERRLL